MNKVQPYFLLVLVAGSFALAFFIFRPFLAPLFLAAVFAVVLEPLHRRILPGFRSFPGVAAFLTVLVAVVGILLPLTLIGLLIAREAESLYAALTADGGASLSTPLLYLESFIETYFPGSEEFSKNLSANLDAYVKQGLQWVIDNLGRAFSSIAGLLLKFFIFFIALYYLLRDGAKFRKAVIELSPLSDADDEAVSSRLELAVNSVIKGNLAIALIQGMLTAVGFAVFGIPNAVLWGTVAALAALIPGVGTSLVFIPAIAFLAVTGEGGSAFGLFVWGVAAVGLIDNFLGPKLVGRGMQLHPLLVLLAVLGGLALFGPVGIFVGPLAMSLLLAFLSIYSDSRKGIA
ncbi:MAG: AI-2E family transporter [bacterium]|nr:AI-2E family transporter [bacterium]